MFMTDIKDFQALLAAEKDQLEEDLETHGRKVNGDWQGESSESAPEADPNTTANQIEELAINVPLVEGLESRYREVAAALKRIDEGSYGKCAVCGENIPPERLEANPAATTCIEHTA